MISKTVNKYKSRHSSDRGGFFREAYNAKRTEFGKLNTGYTETYRDYRNHRNPSYWPMRGAKLLQGGAPRTCAALHLELSKLIYPLSADELRLSPCVSLSPADDNCTGRFIQHTSTMARLGQSYKRHTYISLSSPTTDFFVLRSSYTKTKKTTVPSILLLLMISL